MISAVIVTALGSVTFSISKSYISAERKGVKLKEYCKIDRLVDNLFKNAVPFSWVDRQNSNGFNSAKNVQKLYFIGDANYLLLSSKQPIFSSEDTGFIFSEFFVLENKLMVRYKSTPFMELKNFTSKNIQDGRVEIISERVESIEFLYGKFINKKVVWNNDFNESKSGDIDEVYDELLPIAIQLTIKWQDGRIKHWLRRTAGASRYSAWGRSDINPITGKKLKILNDSF